MRKIALTLVAALACFAALAGCAQPQSAPEPVEAELPQVRNDDYDVRLMVFQYLMKDHPRGMVAYIAFGRGEERWIPAPATFLHRLAQKGYTVAPSSAARIPALGRAAQSGGLEPIRDHDGKPARLYYVRLKSWTDENTVEAEGGRAETPFPSSGVRCVARRVEGRTWRMDEVSTW